MAGPDLRIAQVHPGVEHGGHFTAACSASSRSVGRGEVLTTTPEMAGPPYSSMKPKTGRILERIRPVLDGIPESLLPQCGNLVSRFHGEPHRLAFGALSAISVG